MDNLDPDMGNQDPAAEGSQAAAAPAAAPAAPAFSWKSRVGEDLSKAPSLGKFADTPEGLAEVAKSYVNLEKLLGHEKVPLPKGPEDAAGRAAFNKAMGVPDSAEGYALPDVKLPGDMGNLTFNKASFQGIVHKYGLTPDQAKGLWTEYTNMSGNVYRSHIAQFEAKLNENINTLRSEWGDAYAGNVELGDMAISKLADSQEMGEWLMATLSKHPYGMKFLAKVGNTFAENKVGDFQYKRFGMTPEEAQNEVAKIKTDPNHPYNSEKATDKDHQAAVDHVNRLFAISLGKKF
jgi:hypothetical protein